MQLGFNLAYLAPLVFVLMGLALLVQDNVRLHYLNIIEKLVLEVENLVAALGVLLALIVIVHLATYIICLLNPHP